MLKPAQVTGLQALFLARYRGASAMAGYRNKQIHRLVRHAYENVPYYRKRMDAHGVKPVDIRTIEDLRAIPMTTKKDLQQIRPGDLIARGVDVRSLIIRKTSGSTGEPRAICRTWMEERLLQAFRHRAMRALGQKVFDQVFFVGRVRPSHPRDGQFFMRAANVLGIHRKIRADCFLPFSNIISLLQTHRVDLLCGLTGALFHLAAEILQKGRRVANPRMIVTGGEQITPYMRRQIEAAFGAPVFDTYGSHEFNLLAWECKSTGNYHLCDDTVISEVMKDGRPAQPGEQGELVGTNLLSYAMPILRYRLGDIVTQGSGACSCGASYSTIQKINGRMIDYLVIDNRKIHPYQIVRFLVHDQGSWVRQYQIVQDRANRVVVKVVPFLPPHPDRLRQIEKQISSALGEQNLFRIELVSDIPRAPSGKYMVCQSLLNSMYDR